jgi:hypothetical protein
MESGLRARQTRAHSNAKPRSERLNGIEMLMFGLIAMAMVDCTVIGWLIAHGLAN